jgi:tRNA uridine 5-carboxymethylaminomethyl modification enzyme
LAKQGITVRPDGRWRSVFDLLGHPKVAIGAVMAAYPWLRGIPSRVLDQLQTEGRYDGYLPRQQADIRAFQREEQVDLADVAFEQVGGLSSEMRVKLATARPDSLGAASRIQGMTPAALAAIAAYVRRQREARAV